MIRDKFPYTIPQDSGDKVVSEHIALLWEQFQEWNEKLDARRDKSGYASTYHWVWRTDGGSINKVPDSVLINAADGWWYNFGGQVEFRQNGKAYVVVYVD